jgi:hypothetical protein
MEIRRITTWLAAHYFGRFIEFSQEDPKPHAQLLGPRSEAAREEPHYLHHDGDGGTRIKAELPVDSKTFR